MQTMQSAERRRIPQAVKKRRNEMEHNLNKKSSALALVPFLIFVVIYLGAGLILQALLRVPGHHPLRRAAAVRRVSDGGLRHKHQPHGHHPQSVVLLGAGHCGHRVHLRPLCRRRLQEGPLELGI